MPVRLQYHFGAELPRTLQSVLISESHYGMKGFLIRCECNTDKGGKEKYNSKLP